MKTYASLLAATLTITFVGVGARGAQHGARTRLRGTRSARRVTEAAVPTPTAYCNSIGCPNKYVPIADAHTVECVGGECKVEQCCSLLCSSFGCAAGTNPIPYADTTSCENGVCTQELCCDAGQPQAQHGSCMSYACPAGFASIDNAADKDCKHDPNDVTVPPKPAPGPGSDGDDGIYSYGYDDESSSFKDFFDENFPYDLSYDLSDDYEWDSDAWPAAAAKGAAC
ncbi:unnamed protein product [Sphacelaria rigidula]